jgi:aryl-alcohol dehydrogenase-like predicted oxidoreductase
MTMISGRRIEGIGLGTAPLSFRDGTAAEAVATVRAAVDAGVGLIDTAAIGLSNVTIAQLDEARAAAPIAAVQNRLSYADPADLPTALACARRGISYLAYAPLAGPSGPLLAAALAVASRRRASVQRVMLAWLRAQAPGIVPLVGASRPASILDSADLLDLAGHDLAGLNAARLRGLHEFTGNPRFTPP